MRHTLIELGLVALGLAVAVLLIWIAAWAYPLGAWTIHRVGAVVLVIVLLINVRPLRDAWAKDRNRNG